MKAYEVLIVVGVVALLLLPRLWRGSRRPKETTFRCARCSAVAAHTDRTIEAWRSGKEKLFCNSCHTEWLRRQPSNTGSRQGARSGCLSVVAALIFIPLCFLAIQRLL